MNNRRRYTIISISVLIGTLLSVLLVYSKKGKVDSNDKFMIITNFVFGLAIVVAIGIVMTRMDRKNKKKEEIGDSGKGDR